MAEPLLQPALFDRLADDARTITRVDVELDAEAVVRLGVTAQEIITLLEARGLRRVDADGSALRFVAIGFLVQPSELKSLSFTPRAGARKVRVHECGTLTASSSVNREVDAQERRGLSMQRLRMLVRRDLNALLNTASLDSVEDLSRFPRVARSVVNFGMPSLAGRDAGSLDPKAIADRIRRAVECFEPRLSRVSVTPEAPAADEIEGGVAFRIEAQLWGQPFPEALALRTRIDVDSGQVHVDDATRGV